MSSDLSTHQPQWSSSLRSCLRLLIAVLSGTVATMLLHTLWVYRGNRYIDLRSGELPMTWPARTNLAPTLVLFSIALANCLASVAVIVLSLKKCFRRPIRSRDMYRVIAGTLAVIMWVAAIVVFFVIDKASKASLGRYSCTNKNVMSNGRYQYRAVCSEQSLAFYAALGAAAAELVNFSTLVVSAIKNAKRSSPLIDEKFRRDEKRNIKNSGRFA
ncbi:hypothetical protein EJ04DRAFT_428002 [Polyplosphaeria fusca]|uniref:Uncharacterized protein n=1 Tax=Polyplosphaeria fusca TaxID=682080 RepID=A0A9P4R6L3_9PLEO|nr:hypothetical protein EJ04DRAFT_428002 [Polyplosphaeria fusca]